MPPENRRDGRLNDIGIELGHAFSLRLRGETKMAEDRIRLARERGDFDNFMDEQLRKWEQRSPKVAREIRAGMASEPTREGAERTFERLWLTAEVIEPLVKEFGLPNSPN